jgi:hypothetical protein
MLCIEPYPNLLSSRPVHFHTVNELLPLNHFHNEFMPAQSHPKNPVSLHL